MAGTPLLPGSPTVPENFEASILLAPKAPKQNFGCQPQTLEGEEGGVAPPPPRTAYGRSTTSLGGPLLPGRRVLLIIRCFPQTGAPIGSSPVRHLLCLVGRWLSFHRFTFNHPLSSPRFTTRIRTPYSPHAVPRCSNPPSMCFLPRPRPPSSTAHAPSPDAPPVSGWVSLGITLCHVPLTKIRGRGTQDSVGSSCIPRQTQ